MIRFFGDTETDLWGRAKGVNQTFLAPPDTQLGADSADTTNLLVGDARSLFCRSRGGDDTLAGADNTDGTDSDTNRLFGDAEERIGGCAQGGNDHLTGGAGGGYGASNRNEIRGDAALITGFARGGDDTLTGGNAASNLLIGDADLLRGFARGGADHIAAGDTPRGSSILYGDAVRMEGHAQGGDDVLDGGAGYVRAHNILYGDAAILDGQASGGDDILIAGTGTFNDMWGDAASRAPGTTTGHDLFILAASSQSQINDFESGQDRIDVSALGIASFEALGLITDPSFGTVLPGGNRVANVFAMTEADFIFA